MTDAARTLEEHRRLRLKWRFAIGIGMAVAGLFLMLSFAAVLGTDVDATTRHRLDELLGDQQAAQALAAGANGLAHHRALVELAVALAATAAATGLWFPALQELRRDVVAAGPLAGGILLSVPAGFVIFGVSWLLAHLLFS